ncbi:MAG: molybdopterin-guanine dinucleotide biosynthesis protein MobB, partial [Nitrososphaera sp.]
MLVIAVVGRKKSGKTTIVEGVTGALTKLGCRVAVLKHIHHDDFDVDVPGK